MQVSRLLACHEQASWETYSKIRALSNKSLAFVNWRNTTMLNVGSLWKVKRGSLLQSPTANDKDRNLLATRLAWLSLARVRNNHHPHASLAVAIHPPLEKFCSTGKPKTHQRYLCFACRSRLFRKFGVWHCHCRHVSYYPCQAIFAASATIALLMCMHDRSSASQPPFRSRHRSVIGPQ